MINLDIFWWVSGGLVGLGAIAGLGYGIYAGKTSYVEWLIQRETKAINEVLDRQLPKCECSNNKEQCITNVHNHARALRS